jgi:hypothetical protein
MKITKRRLNQIITEETREVLKEQERGGGWGEMLGTLLSTAPAFRAAHGGVKKLGSGLETEKAREQLKKCIQKKCKHWRSDEYWDERRAKTLNNKDKWNERRETQCKVVPRSGPQRKFCNGVLKQLEYAEWSLGIIDKRQKNHQKLAGRCKTKCGGELTGFSGLQLGTPQQKAYAKKLAQAIHDGDLAKEQLQKIMDCAQHTVTSAMDDVEAIWDAIVAIPTAKKRVAGGHITKINGVVVHEEKRYVNDSLAATGKAINTVASIFFKWQDDECLKKSMNAIGSAIMDFVTGDSDEEIQRRARIRANRQLKLDVEYKNKYGSKAALATKKPDWGRGGKPPPGYIDPRTGLARARRGGGGPMTARGSGQKRTPPGRATAPDQRRGRRAGRRPRIPTARR